MVTGGIVVGVNAAAATVPNAATAAVVTWPAAAGSDGRGARVTWPKNIVSATPPLALAAVVDNATAGDGDGDGSEDVDVAKTGGGAAGGVGSGRSGRVTCPKKMVSSTWRTGGGVTVAVTVITAGDDVGKTSLLATAPPPAVVVVLLFVLGFRFT
jgi:hypothetical protein